MVNRRSFVRTLGASTVLPALSQAWAGFASAPSESVAGTRSRVDLNGQWERRVGDELFDLVEVPSSLRPSGYYQLRREFLLIMNSSRQAASIMAACRFWILHRLAYS